MVSTLQKSLTINRGTVINARRRRNAYDTFCSSGGCRKDTGVALNIECFTTRIGRPATLTPLKSAESPEGEEIRLFLESCSCPPSSRHTQAGKRQALLENACHLPCCHISEARISQSPPALPHHHHQNPCPDLHEMMLAGEGEGVKRRAGRRTVRYKA